MEFETNYSYEKLRDGPARRLIELKPSKDFWGPLHCELIDDIKLRALIAAPDKIESEYRMAQQCYEKPKLLRLQHEQGKPEGGSPVSNSYFCSKKDMLDREVNDARLDLVRKENQYKNIDREAIRLLELKLPTEFEAVSYTWGPVTTFSKLHCDKRGSYVKIRANVDTMLRNFRKTKKSRYLWIDAISINQEDEGEEASQIPQMGDIYSEARNVLIWIGDDSDTGEKVFKFLRNINNSRSKNISAAEDVSLSMPQIQNELRKVFKNDSIEPIQGFLSLPWFKRRWIIQESGPCTKLRNRFRHSEDGLPGVQPGD
jgi:hypothetical protein